MLTREGLKTKRINTESNIVEMVAIEVEINNEKIIIATLYMPPHTRTWDTEDYKELTNHTIRSLENLVNMTTNKNIGLILTGDFNSNIDWNELETTQNAYQWSRNLLNFAIEHCLHQNVTENTRVRGMENPSLLDLVFTKNSDDIKEILYRAPIGKSDHAVLEMNFITKEEIQSKGLTYNGKKFNYVKGDYNGLRNFFKNVNWTDMTNEQNINKQYNIFCKTYKKGTKEYIPEFKEYEKPKKCWFNNRCELARDEKNRQWKRYLRHPSDPSLQRYKTARNKFTEIIRERQIEYEKNIVERGIEQPKIFYKHIKSKTK